MRIIAILLTIFISSLCYAQEENFDVRNVKWGMTKNEVLNSELPNNPFVQDKNSLAYNDTIDGKTITILYEFNDDKLYRVIYNFDINNSVDDNLFRRNIINILEKKYTRDQKKSNNQLLKGFFDEFFNNNTSVSVFTKNEDMIIVYQTLESKNAMDKETNKKLEKRKKEIEKAF